MGEGWEYTLPIHVAGSKCKSALSWSVCLTHLEPDIPLSLNDLHPHSTLFPGPLDLGYHELDPVPKLHLLLLGVIVEGDHTQLARLPRVVDAATAFRSAMGRGEGKGSEEKGLERGAERLLNLTLSTYTRASPLLRSTVS